jgi:hypothetical protein
MQQQIKRRGPVRVGTKYNRLNSLQNVGIQNRNAKNGNMYVLMRKGFGGRRDGLLVHAISALASLQ